MCDFVSNTLCDAEVNRQSTPDTLRVYIKAGGCYRVNDGIRALMAV